MSLYSFANGHVGMSLKLLYRARYLLVLICGEDHPEVALIDVSSGFIDSAVVLIILTRITPIFTSTEQHQLNPACAGRVRVVAAFH